MLPSVRCSGLRELRVGTGQQRVVPGFGYLDQQLPVHRMLGDVKQLYEPQMIGAAPPSVDHVLSLGVGAQEMALWASQHGRPFGNLGH